MNWVKTDMRDRVAVVTLDDPKRRNAMSLAMAESMTTTFRALESSPEVGAVVLTGAPPAFSAGADLDDLEQACAQLYAMPDYSFMTDSVGIGWDARTPTIYSTFPRFIGRHVRQCGETVAVLGRPLELEPGGRFLHELLIHAPHVLAFAAQKAHCLVDELVVVHK